MIGLHLFLFLINLLQFHSPFIYLWIPKLLCASFHLCFRFTPNIQFYFVFSFSLNSPSTSSKRWYFCNILRELRPGRFKLWLIINETRSQMDLLQLKQINTLKRAIIPTMLTTNNSSFNFINVAVKFFLCCLRSW